MASKLDFRTPKARRKPAATDTAPFAVSGGTTPRDIASTRHALTMRILDKYQISPLQVLMEAMLDARGRALDARERAQNALLDGAAPEEVDALTAKSAAEYKDAAGYAVAAAPYAHPKLAAMAMDIKQETKAQLRIVSEFADAPTVIDNQTGEAITPVAAAGQLIKDYTDAEALRELLGGDE